MLCVLHELRGYRRLPFRIAHFGKHKRLLILLATVLLLSLLGVCILTEVKLYHHLRSIFGGNKDASENWSDKGHVVPPNEQVDYILKRRDCRSNTVRVMLAMVATQITEKPCFSIASAHFADLPVVAVGNGEKHDHNSKIKFTLDVARLAGMSDSDVVMVLDSDVMFTGLDMLPYTDKLIAQSPPSSRELDVKAVREGRAMAPSVYSTEANCWADNLFGVNRNKCIATHRKLEEAIEKYADAHRDSLTLVTQKMYETPRYINTGTSIHRIWSLRELRQSGDDYIAHNKPGDKPFWNDDQGMIHAEYVWLRYWEMEHDVYLNETLARTQRTPQGLRAGQLALDVFNEMAAVELPPYLDDDTLQWTNENYGVRNSMVWSNVSKHDPDILIQKSILDKGGMSKVPLMPRHLTHIFGTSTTIDLAPPFISLFPRHVNGLDKPAVRVFPPLVHYAGYLKNTHMRRELRMALWYIPMILDGGRWQRGKDYLLSLPMELWNATSRRARVRYADVCPQHPFSVPPTWD